MKKEEEDIMWASMVWIGHISYASSPWQVIFRTKKDAQAAGWPDPTQVNITIEKVKTGRLRG